MKKLFLYMIFATSLVRADESYRLQTDFSSGAVTFVNVYGGDYFYLPEMTDARLILPAILVSRPPREYEYFSAEEEVALSNLYDILLEKKIKARLVAERKAYLAKVKRYNWPKVVIQDGEICVPELSSSEADNWQEHLICYEEKSLPAGGMTAEVEVKSPAEKE